MKRNLKILLKNLLIVIPPKGICLYFAQVIFHAVEQLKLLQSEEATHTSTNSGNPSTSPITLTDLDQQTTSQDSSTSLVLTSQEDSNAEEEESNSEDTSRNEEEQAAQQSQESKPEEDTSKIQEEEASTDRMEEASKIEDGSEDSKEALSDERKPVEEKMEDNAKPIGSYEDHTRVQGSPELNEETPETSYATPETNYEEPEQVHAAQETNEEVAEENHEWISSIDTETRVEVTTADSVTVIDEKKKEPTIDSVVQGVYEILKPTTSKFVDEELLEESKSVGGVGIEKMEKMERAEEESDENR